MSIKPGQPQFGFPFVTKEDAASEEPGLCVSPDGSRATAAATHPDGSTHVAVWNTVTGECLSDQPQPCSVLALSPDGAWLAVGDESGRVTVRPIGSQTPTIEFNQTRARIDSLAFGRDPSQPSVGASATPWLLAAGDGGGTIWVFQLAQTRVRSICRGSYYNIYALAFSEDGATLASARRASLKLWDTGTGRLIQTPCSLDFAVALGFSPDGSRLAVAGQRGFNASGRIGVLEFHPPRGVQLLRGLSSHSGNVAFSPDGERVAALAHDWQVGVWNRRSNRLESLFEAPMGILADNAALAFSNDGRELAYCTSGEGRLWQLDTGKEIRLRSIPGERSFGQRAAFDATGKLLLFQWERFGASNAGTCVLRAWRAETGWQTLTNFVAFQGRLFFAAMAATGDFLAVSGAAPERSEGMATQVLYDVRNNREVRRWAVPRKNEAAVRLAPDGSLFGRMEYAGTNRWTELLALPSLQPLENRPDLPTAISPGGRWVSLQPEDGTDLLRRSQPPRLLHFGTGFWGPMNPTFSPDGRWLGRGLTDGSVLLCDLEETLRQLESEGLGW